MSDGLSEEIQWTELMKADGLTVGELLVNQLREAGIPAYVWQQAAGTALGITFGPLGEVHIMVPEEKVAEARDFLAATPIDGPDEDDEDDFDDYDEYEDDDYEEDADYDDFDEYDADDEYVSRCPHCGTIVDLDEEEVVKGWYECPRCGRRVRL